MANARLGKQSSQLASQPWIGAFPAQRPALQIAHRQVGVIYAPSIVRLGAHQYRPTRPRHADHLLGHPGRIATPHQHKVTGNQIEPAVGKDQIVGIANLVLGLPATLLRIANHLWIKIHTDHAAPGPGRDFFGYHAGATTDVEHALSPQQVSPAVEKGPRGPRPTSLPGKLRIPILGCHLFDRHVCRCHSPKHPLSGAPTQTWIHYSRCRP